MYKRYYYLGFLFTILPIILIIQSEFYYLIYYLIFSSILGYILNKKYLQEKFYTQTFDNERRLRYELEHIKNQLINNSKEIERLTEIKERNRIAREIHDHIGHDIAGVLFQLQAAEKIHDNNPTKSIDIVALCSNKLSQTLELIRNTVYNIKPVLELNENVFKNVINQFVFCPVQFKFDGNIQMIKSDVLELLLANLKESLTNASKHSGATEIQVKIEANQNFIRFYYQDNGKGCQVIKEGLGVTGMKERIKNLGGMININGINGFSIVCIIPNQKTKIFSG